MSILIRAILIVSLLMQSLPGLVMQRCVAMPEASSLTAMGMPANAKCGCCGESDVGSRVECPLADSGYVGCNCQSPQPEDPKAPPSDHQKSQQIEQLFAAAAPAVTILLPQPLPRHVRWTAFEPPNRCGSNSIQSLLCV
ncbi:MAG: hypothetical protein JNM07_13465 [Phycisphaerae bacterium]|nr:hypothetical protein [Phycisphaerae bacterium]